MFGDDCGRRKAESRTEGERPRSLQHECRWDGCWDTKTDERRARKIGCLCWVVRSLRRVAPPAVWRRPSRPSPSIRGTHPAKALA